MSEHKDMSGRLELGTGGRETRIYERHIKESARSMVEELKDLRAINADLLEALEKFTEWYAEAGADIYQDDEGLAGLAKNARTAILKAQE